MTMTDDQKTIAQEVCEAQKTVDERFSGSNAAYMIAREADRRDDGTAGPQKHLVPPPSAPPFTSSRAELLFALLSYIAAYCYIDFFSRFTNACTVRAVWTARLLLLLVAVFIIVSAEYLNRKRSDGMLRAEDENAADTGFPTIAETVPETDPSAADESIFKTEPSETAKRPAGTDHREHLVWLTCFLLCLLGFYLHFSSYILMPPVSPDEYLVFETWREGVWNGTQTLLFIHIFAVWWVISRSGVLAEGRSGHLLPLDALNGFFVLPFGNFFLRIRTWLWGIREARRGKKALLSAFSWHIAAAALVCLALFLTVLKLLGSADLRFDRLLSGLREILRFEPDPELVSRVLFSLPVGAWLWGLIGGSLRRPHEKTETQRISVLRALTGLRGIPTGFWIAVVGLFSLAYAVFYVLQASYLFGAFAGRLPEGFIVSQYAREGFFELCRVITVNFALLWLVTRMTRAGESDSLTLKVLCLVLLAESALFAVVALSKLVLYISIFGFTPLRLQSSWLVCTLLAGCALWAWSLLTGNPAFRKWMIFGAVSLSLLCLY